MSAGSGDVQGDNDDAGTLTGSVVFKTLMAHVRLTPSLSSSCADSTLGPVLHSVILNYGKLLYDYSTLPHNMHYGP
eukprot:7499120-Ditylum_brightwellii.AAC.1